MRIAFAMESLRFSGGHQVVAEHARQLTEQHGFEVALVDCFGNASLRWDFGLPESVGVVALDDLGDEPFDVAVATWWSTASVVGRIPATRYAYFVQSLEDRWFSPDQPESGLARLTLDLGMPVITEATWIADVMRAYRPGAPCHLVRNGIDKDVFPLGTDRPLRGEGQLRVLVEAGTGHSPNKGVPETLAALNLTTEPVHTTIVGDLGGLQAPAHSTIVAVVPQHELSAMYAQHDVMLKTSRVEGMYGPPLEAFHRGATLVTTPVTGHDEFVVAGHNALLVDWDDPVGAARAVDLLSKDRDLLEQLRTHALETAHEWPSWTESGKEMAEALNAVASGAPDALAHTSSIYLGSERFAFEAGLRTHSLKVRLDAATEHMEKLQYSWYLSEESRERAEAQLEELRAQDERLRTDLAIARSAAEAAEARNSVLQFQLDMRLEARLARVVKRIRDYLTR